MHSRKAQVSTEYLIITAIVLGIAITIFAYGYMTHQQNMRISQANNALDKIVNQIDIVHALGPDNNRFLDVAFPADIESIQDIVVCNDGTQGNNVDCSSHSGVRAGGIEMGISSLAGTLSLKRPTKAVVELDGFGAFESLEAKEGSQKLKVFWCNSQVCLKRKGGGMATGHYCGDGSCDPTETCSNCPNDCGECS